MKVWKYVLSDLDAIAEGQYRFTITMPKGSKVLKMDTLHDVNGNHIHPEMWVLVNPDNEQEEREFYSVGTGYGKVRDGDEHIGTVIAGRFVWHIFEPSGG